MREASESLRETINVSDIVYKYPGLEAFFMLLWQSLPYKVKSYDNSSTRNVNECHPSVFISYDKLIPILRKYLTAINLYQPVKEAYGGSLSLKYIVTEMKKLNVQVGNDEKPMLNFDQSKAILAAWIHHCDTVLGVSNLVQGRTETRPKDRVDLYQRQGYANASTKMQPRLVRTESLMSSQTVHQFPAPNRQQLYSPMPPSNETYPYQHQNMAMLSALPPTNMMPEQYHRPHFTPTQHTSYMHAVPIRNTGGNSELMMPQGLNYQHRQVHEFAHRPPSQSCDLVSQFSSHNTPPPGMPRAIGSFINTVLRPKMQKNMNQVFQKTRRNQQRNK